ncbi:MAG: hypothetical protein JRJ85_25140 [Deltaproteobacteria bacterium]|nr:hypothetical protein [Deltaproteobacteria bacterium]
MDGTGTGTFTSSLTGLTWDTTYHVRAYVTNSLGTFYGDDLTFGCGATITISKAGAGSGTVKSTPAAIYCGGTCNAYFAIGAEMTLTAGPDAGSAFDGWSGGDCTGNGDCLLTMDQDRTVTATFNPDTEGDGISDIIENAGPSRGDGNGNGTLDLFENNVVTFRTIYGDYITLVSQVGTTLTNFVFQGCPCSRDRPAGACFGCGFFGFTLQGLAPGASTTVTAILHSGPTCSSYYRYGPTPDNATDHWYRFFYNGRTGARFSYEGGQTLVTLYFKDGGRGDDDLTANGVIVDVGGPVTVGSVEPGGDGGGCFIRGITGE